MRRYSISRAGEDFEAEVFLVFEAVGTPQDDANLVVETLELCLHVLHLQRFDGVPIKRQLLRNIRDRRLAAAAADKIGKALGVERVVCQKVEPSLPEIPRFVTFQALKFMAPPYATASHWAI